jgi:hypothetical protein
MRLVNLYNLLYVLKVGKLWSDICLFILLFLESESGMGGFGSDILIKLSVVLSISIVGSSVEVGVIEGTIGGEVVNLGSHTLIE